MFSNDRVPIVELFIHVCFCFDALRFHTAYFVECLFAPLLKCGTYKEANPCLDSWYAAIFPSYMLTWLRDCTGWAMGLMCRYRHYIGP